MSPLLDAIRIPSSLIGSIDGIVNGVTTALPFVAGVSADSVRGVGNGSYQYAYTAMPFANFAALSDTMTELEQKIRDKSTSTEQAGRIIRAMTLTLSGHKQR